MVFEVGLEIDLTLWFCELIGSRGHGFDGLHRVCGFALLSVNKNETPSVNYLAKIPQPCFLTFTWKRLSKQCEQLVGDQTASSRPESDPTNGTSRASPTASGAQHVAMATLVSGRFDDVQANGTLEQLGDALKTIGELLQ